MGTKVRTLESSRQDMMVARIRVGAEEVVRYRYRYRYRSDTGYILDEPPVRQADGSKVGTMRREESRLIS